MANEAKPDASDLDPAAVFACAHSLWSAVHRSAGAEPINLSEAYNGIDQLMREVMRVGSLFESWACAHVEFDELNDVWPYLLEDKFGDACMKLVFPSALAGFDECDCLHVALALRLPVRADEGLHVPVDLRAANPIEASAFREVRIQTVRNDVEDGDVSPFTADDDPFDENFGPPYFALYGVGSDGLLEHIADRKSYGEICRLADKLWPGISLPKTATFCAPNCLHSPSCPPTPSR